MGNPFFFRPNPYFSRPLFVLLLFQHYSDLKQGKLLLGAQVFSFAQLILQMIHQFIYPIILYPVLQKQGQAKGSVPKLTAVNRPACLLVRLHIQGRCQGLITQLRIPHPVKGNPKLNQRQSG